MTMLRIHYFSLWLPDQAFGRVVIDVSQAPTYAAYGILAKYIGFDYTILERVIQFFPIIFIAPLGSYLLLKSIVKSRMAIVAGIFVYCFNTYFLILQTGDVTLASAYAFAPLVIYLYDKALRKLSSRLAVLAGLSEAVTCAYEPRIFLIIAVITFSYFVYTSLFGALKTSSKLKYIAIGLLPFSVVILLNFYWILGFTQIKVFSGSSLLSRSLFGSNFYSLTEALTLHFPFWSGSTPTTFVVNSIPLYFWVIPLMAVSGLYLKRKDKRILFFGIIALSGIFLTKQAAAPITSFYQWLFDNVPGFSVYREASKFYILTCLGFSVLIASLIDWLASQDRHRWKSLSVVAALVIIAVFGINTLPLINSEIGTLFVSRSMPSDYVKYNNFINNQNTYFRTLWVPIDSRWAANTSMNPTVDLSQLYSSSWQSFSNLSQQGYNPTDWTLLDMFNKSYSQSLLKDGEFKYVIVPIRDNANDDDFFINYGSNRPIYVNSLNKISWLERINIGTKTLAVYELKSYEPYVSSFSQLINMPTTDNLDSSFTIAQKISNNSGPQFNIAATPYGQETEITDVFNDLKRSNLTSDAITSSISDNELRSRYIYVNNGQYDITYKVHSSQITFYAQNASFGAIKNDSVTLRPGPTTELNTISLSSNNDDYYFKIGTTLYKVNSNISSGNLGSVETNPRIISASKVNIFPHPLIEQGTWQKNVSDCDSYGSNPEISMKLNNLDKTIGTHSLELRAGKNTACTETSNIKVIPNMNYLLSFDEKVSGGQKFGYEVDFPGTHYAAIEEYPEVTNGIWRPYTTELQIPAYASQIRITFMGFPTEGGTGYATTLYDNFRISEASQAGIVDYDATPNYIKAPLGNHTNLKLVYQEDKTTDNGANLIQDGNLSQGLWQKKVGDCNNYDSNPVLSMKLSAAHSSGIGKSLELDTTRHTSCTNPKPVTVKENNQYLLSFMYQSPNSSDAGYYISFNDPAHTVISEQLPIANKQWHEFDKTLTAPYGATQMTISIYGYASGNGKTDINRYDNFYLAAISSIQNEYYLVDPSDEILHEPKSTSLKANSPTKKIIQVSGATTPFYLSMSESYNPGWRLEIYNNKVKGLRSWLPTGNPDIVPSSDHYDLDDFANGWYVNVNQICRQQRLCNSNANGTYNLTLEAEFAPERYFNVGLIISGLTLTACISYLGTYYLSSRWQKKHADMEHYIVNRRR